jgi:hypothetical protein
VQAAQMREAMLWSCYIASALSAFQSGDNRAL